MYVNDSNHSNLSQSFHTKNDDLLFEARIYCELYFNISKKLNRKIQGLSLYLVECTHLPTNEH